MWLFDGMIVMPWAGWLILALAVCGTGALCWLAVWAVSGAVSLRRAEVRRLDGWQAPELEPLPPERSWDELTGEQAAVESVPGWYDHLRRETRADGWECPQCGSWSPEFGYCYSDHSGRLTDEQRYRAAQIMEHADDHAVVTATDTAVSYARGPASLPRPDPRSNLAALMADVMGPQNERLAAPIVPDWVNADLEAAGFKTYETNTAAVDSMVMRAIQ
jgi:hypothetical protein